MTVYEVLNGFANTTIVFPKYTVTWQPSVSKNAWLFKKATIALRSIVLVASV